MHQIKCPKCAMITNINPDKFIASFDMAEKVTASVAYELHCVSCGETIPSALITYLKCAIRKKGFDGWDIGTMFPPQPTGSVQ